jgi:ribosome recycling factor
MDIIITDFSNSLQNIILQLKEDLKSIRTGRATGAVFENLIVETYGGQSKLRLMELSTINNEGPAVISITPYDSSTLGDIEKSILKSPLGVSPQVQGNKILIRIPPLSEEQRQKLVKYVNQKIEEKRVVTRNERDEIRKKIKTQFENKEISEDQKFRLEKDIDNLTQKTNAEMEIIRDNKEKEILEV